MIPPARRVPADATRAGDASADATRLMFEATFVFWGHFVGRAAELGLAPTQAHALTMLDPERSMTMRQLADALECDPSTVTGVADRLEAQGFIERQVLPGDRRVRALALTAPGMERRARLVERLLEAPESIRGLDDDGLRCLVRALQAILGHEAGRRPTGPAVPAASSPASQARRPCR